LLVGKTAANTSTVGIEARENGLLVATRDGGQPLLIDRLTDHGDLILLRKDSSSVGVIGTQNWGIGTSSPNQSSAGTQHSVLTLKGSGTLGNGIFELIQKGTSGNNQTLGDIRFFDNTNQNVSIEALRATSTDSGYLTFKTRPAAGSLTERLRIDSAGVVDIKSGGTASAPSLIFEGDTNTGLFHGGDTLGFSTAGQERARLDASGNLLVGKTSTSQTVEGIVLQGADGRLNASADGNVAGIFNRLTNDGDIFLFRKDGTTVGTIGTQNWGIGTSSPAEKLDVSGAAVFTGSHATGTNAYGAAQGVMIHATSSTGFVTAVSNGANDVDLQLRGLNGGNANANQLVLDSSGNVGIGTTSPQELIHAYSGSSTAIRASGGANNNKKVEIGYDNTNGPYLKGGSSGITSIQFYVDNTTLAGKFDTNADFYTNDGTVHSLSDSRVKTDIKDLIDGLDVVKQLQPKTFKYNEKSEFYSEKTKDEVRYGFIADEVKEVAPQYIQVGKGKIDGVEVDDFKTLSTTKMIPMLVKAIQEQQAQIEALQSEINLLKGE